MKVDSGMYHYTESGLQNVWLKNGFLIEEIDGQKSVAIEDIDGLHRAIGSEICRSRFITGDEFRFLRKELDYSQARLGEVFGVSENTIANWERNSSIPKAVTALLKAMYFDKVNVQYTATALAIKTEQVEEAQLPAMEFFEENGKWLKKAA